MEAIIALVIIIFSAIIHEVSHGYVADKLGDPTARLSGRLTLDPRPHIDPVMSIAVPLLLLLSGSPVIFGGAKPVPVDPFNLREGRKDVALVSLAGPLSNVLLAIAAAILFRVFDALPVMIPSFIGALLYLIAKYNLILAVFNLVPIPPLDGSKVLALILPDRQAASYLAIGQFGVVLIFLLLAFPIGGFSLGEAMFLLTQNGLRILGFPV